MKNLVNLLIVPIEKENLSLNHFILIKKLNKFLSNSYNI